MSDSISSSVSSGSLKPSSPKILIPLSAYGLWLALMTMPASARMLLVSCATAGVGIGPHKMTRPPMLQMPAAIACSIMYPERRVSLPMSTRGVCGLPRPATKVIARPSLSASSGVIAPWLARPRMPSVPKYFRSVDAFELFFVSWDLARAIFVSPRRVPTRARPRYAKAKRREQRENVGHALRRRNARGGTLDVSPREETMDARRALARQRGERA